MCKQTEPGEAYILLQVAVREADGGQGILSLLARCLRLLGKLLGGVGDLLLHRHDTRERPEGRAIRNTV